MIAPLRSAAAAALLLLLCIAALCPAALAGGNPSSTAKCPVTINYSESDIPAECMSKEADDVCKKCLGDIVKKTTSQIPETVPCGPDYQKCFEPIAAKLSRTPKVNLVALLGCDQGAVAELIASNIKCKGQRPTAEEIKKGLQSQG